MSMQSSKITFGAVCAHLFIASIIAVFAGFGWAGLLDSIRYMLPKEHWEGVIVHYDVIHSRDAGTNYRTKFLLDVEFADNSTKRIEVKREFRPLSAGNKVRVEVRRLTSSWAFVTSIKPVLSERQISKGDVPQEGVVKSFPVWFSLLLVVFFFAMSGYVFWKCYYDLGRNGPPRWCWPLLGGVVLTAMVLATWWLAEGTQ